MNQNLSEQTPISISVILPVYNVEPWILYAFRFPSFKSIKSCIRIATKYYGNGARLFAGKSKSLLKAFIKKMLR